MRHILLLLCALSTAFFSCKEKTDMEKIEDYLKRNDITNATMTSTGLYYIIEKEGSGGHPTLASTVTVKYKGYLLDGTVFDQTPDNSTATFPLENLIPAWQEAIPLLQKGGKGTFYAPSDLCYGPQGFGLIPPNSVLIFEIELVDF